MPALRNVHKGLASYTAALPFQMVPALIAACVALQEPIKPYAKAKVLRIANEILSSETDPAIAPIQLSIDGRMAFQAGVTKSVAGSLTLDLVATIRVIDGRLRLLAIRKALLVRGAIARDTVTVCIHSDPGEKGRANMSERFNKR